MPTKPATVTEYLVLTGLNYGPDDVRAEVGAVVTDLPTESIGWLLEQGHITATTTTEA